MKNAKYIPQYGGFIGPIISAIAPHLIGPAIGWLGNKIFEVKEELCNQYQQEQL